MTFTGEEYNCDTGENTMSQMHSTAQIYSLFAMVYRLIHDRHEDR